MPHFTRPGIVPRCRHVPVTKLPAQAKARASLTGHAGFYPARYHYLILRALADPAGQSPSLTGGVSNPLLAGVGRKPHRCRLGTNRRQGRDG
jgi:hypothetical protein